MILDHPDGKYARPIAVGWEVPENVEFVSFTVNGQTPTLSEYIAYDTLSPPNPFIAVTQDGLGRVVYDGGFPKFYNNSVPSGAPSASFKYMINAVNWVSKAGMQKRILVLGTKPSAPYFIKGSASTDFKLSLDYIANETNATIAYKDISDYGGTLNATIEELRNYSIVIFMDSDHTNVPKITPACVNALVRYREEGYGLIFITDHGANIADVNFADIGNYSGFFRAANKVVVHFGVYFTGNVNRTPVNVGYIRRTYGDHLLYAGMSDEENIQAGGSESNVVVTQYRRYLPAELPAIYMDDGDYHVQILLRYTNGSINILRHNFIIGADIRAAYRKLLVREKPGSPFISNFTKGGWRVAHDGKFVQMLPSNTKMWDDELKEWVSVK